MLINDTTNINIGLFGMGAYIEINGTKLQTFGEKSKSMFNIMKNMEPTKNNLFMVLQSWDNYTLEGKEWTKLLKVGNNEIKVYPKYINTPLDFHMIRFDVSNQNKKFLEQKVRFDGKSESPIIFHIDIKAKG